jgi:DNA-binding PadR family transcriptional regulator
MRRALRSSLEFALLGLLAQKPQSGYDLRKVFSDTPMRHFSDSPGSIYPALRRLKARKWVTAIPEKDSVRRRELFHIAQAGRQALIRWLQEPFDRSAVVRGLETLLLRFAFFDGNLSRRQAYSFLAHLERELNAYIRELEYYGATIGLLNSLTTGALAFANGLGGYRAHLAWARRARKSLSDEGR